MQDQSYENTQKNRRWGMFRGGNPGSLTPGMVRWAENRPEAIENGDFGEGNPQNDSASNRPGAIVNAALGVKLLLQVDLACPTRGPLLWALGASQALRKFPCTG